MQRPTRSDRESARRDETAGRGVEPARALGLGLTWAASTILFLFAGRWLDGWLRTAPLFTLLGAFVGAGAGFYYMYFHLVIEPRRDRRDGESR